MNGIERIPMDTENPVGREISTLPIGELLNST